MLKFLAFIIAAVAVAVVCLFAPAETKDNAKTAAKELVVETAANATEAAAEQTAKASKKMATRVRDIKNDSRERMKK